MLPIFKERGSKGELLYNNLKNELMRYDSRTYWTETRFARQASFTGETEIDLSFFEDEDEDEKKKMLFDPSKFSKNIEDILLVLKVSKEKALLIKHTIVDQVKFLIDSQKIKRNENNEINDFIASEILENTVDSLWVLEGPVRSMKEHKIANVEILTHKGLDEQLENGKDKLIFFLSTDVERENIIDEVDEIVLHELGVTHSSILMSKCIQGSIISQYSLYRSHYTGYENLDEYDEYNLSIDDDSENDRNKIRNAVNLMVNNAIDNVIYAPLVPRPSLMAYDEQELKNNLLSERMTLTEAVKTIQNIWKRSLSNPNYLMCQWRLTRELNEMNDESDNLPKLMIWLRSRKIQK